MKTKFKVYEEKTGKLVFTIFAFLAFAILLSLYSKPLGAVVFGCLFVSSFIEHLEVETTFTRRKKR